MSGFFTPVTQTVDLGDGNTVVVRKLTFGENADVLSQSLRENGQIDFALHGKLRMHKAVVSWSGAGFEGRPVSPENVDALPLHVTSAIQDALTKLNRDVDEDEGN